MEALREVCAAGALGKSASDMLAAGWKNCCSGLKNTVGLESGLIEQMSLCHKMTTGDARQGVAYLFGRICQHTHDAHVCPLAVTIFCRKEFMPGCESSYAE